MPGASARAGQRAAATRCGCSVKREVREAVRDRRQRVARRRRRAPKRVRTAARTSSSSAHSGRLHRPPQMPSAGRFSNRISPPCSISSTRTARCGSDLARTRRRQLRRCVARCARRNPRPPGRRRSAACVRAHTVAPRSIRPCVYASMPRAGNALSATRHSAASTFGAPGQPAMPRWRASTRFTLPSRIASRAPNANAAIAAAVERPMPGSVASVAASRGKCAAVRRDDRAAPRHAGDARAGSSRGRSSARARRRSARRPAPRHRETRRRSAGSTAPPSRPASAAA